ncbi:MAG: amidohydrolase family protein [Myxococcota bacterium]
MFDGLPVIDGDSHKVENWVILLEYLPTAYQDRVRPTVCEQGYARVMLLDYNPATGKADLPRMLSRPSGPSKGLFAAFHREGTLGGMFSRLRLEHMDREGIDIGLIYPTISMGINMLQDREFAVALARAYNDYILEDCAQAPQRLKPVGLIPLVDVQAGLEEMERVWARGVVGFTVAPSVPVPHPDAPAQFPLVAWPKPISSPEFLPIFEKAVALNAAVGLHGAGPGMYMPGGIYDFTDSFLINHIFGHRNQMQLALSRCVFDGLFEKFPTLRMAFLEGGCGWLPDLMHAFHEHWEKRLRDFDPDLSLDLEAYQREMRHELGEERLRALSWKHRRALTSQLVFHARKGKHARPRTHAEDPYTWESPLQRDPMDYFRQGRLFFGFESDDPGPLLLPTALGEWGEDLAMFSVDYGHWDGEVEGCVRRVSEQEQLTRRHRQKLLSTNALRFYGERLARDVPSWGAAVVPHAA